MTAQAVPAPLLRAATAGLRGPWHTEPAPRAFHRAPGLRRREARVPRRDGVARRHRLAAPPGACGRAAGRSVAAARRGRRGAGRAGARGRRAPAARQSRDALPSGRGAFALLTGRAAPSAATICARRAGQAATSCTLAESGDAARGARASRRDAIRRDSGPDADRARLAAQAFSAARAPGRSAGTSRPSAR
ncbi:MAG: hypothetical protein MZW92_08815 [Comamonadaceae bacterium]|nr:hypothetical protein [Comamonadaceae bacterium]